MTSKEKRLKVKNLILLQKNFNMGQYHLKLPKMGESVTEATVTKWLLEVGDTIQLDDSIVEIATDKVDTDVTSEVEGILTEKCFQENEIVKVGETLVIIEIKGEVVSQSEMNIDLDEDFEPEKNKVPEEIEVSTPKKIANKLELEMEQASSLKTINVQEGNRF